MLGVRPYPSNMSGISFVVDERGKKKAVMIDLEQHERVGRHPRPTGRSIPTPRTARDSSGSGKAVGKASPWLITPSFSSGRPRTRGPPRRGWGSGYCRGFDRWARPHVLL